jgi:Asp-tRNA(Asn)/Glu-tRNA(Gln) amidotransferase B subunit
MVGKVTTDKELQQEAKKVVDANIDLVKRVRKTGKQGPVMHLVGLVMKSTKKRGDPVMIKFLIEEEIAKVKIDPKDLAEVTDEEEK